MRRRPFCFPLFVERLEDRNAPSDTLNALNADLNDPSLAQTAPPPAFLVAG
jgi:hypothetical protein